MDANVSIRAIARMMTTGAVHEVVVLSGRELRGLLTSFDIVGVIAAGFESSHHRQLGDRVERAVGGRQ